MAHSTAPARVFLFLQGPHGPFFARLARDLKRAGCTVWRVGFNAGDDVFWQDRAHYLPFRNCPSVWGKTLEAHLSDLSVTDIVVYGDTRPLHAEALKIARARGLRVHVFEEGYMRPFWITYERDGANGHSKLMEMSIDAMRVALAKSDVEAPLPPGHWGDTRQHVFYGAAYHFLVLFFNRGYPFFRPHRALSVGAELRLYLKRLLLMPLLALDRWIATLRIRQGGFPYHLVLLQLEHDAAFQAHSPFASMTEFLDLTVAAFAKGAPGHHHLVIKAHPLEDGRVPVRRTLRDLTRQHGVLDRVHFVRGGKLARLLDFARSAVTVNSTAGQQALWRGIPLKAFGSAVYGKPELTSDQSLTAFFKAARRPDGAAYQVFRRYLLETSQVPGGFYSRSGRQRLMRVIVDMMLDPHDPYTALTSGTAAPRQQLRAVS